MGWRGPLGLAKAGLSSIISCQKDRQTGCSSFVWLNGNINLQASELPMTLTSVIRGPGSGSFDPNTRLTVHTARRDQSFSKEGGD